MKNLNSAMAPRVIFKGILTLMLVCLATFGVAYFVSNPIDEGASQVPIVTNANFKTVDDIGGGRSQEPPTVEVVDEIGGNRPPIGEFAFCLNSTKDIGGKSTTGEFYNLSEFEIVEHISVGDIAFDINLSTDIGGRSTDGGLLNLTLTDLPIGGGSVPPPPGEFKLAS